MASIQRRIPLNEESSTESGSIWPARKPALFRRPATYMGMPMQPVTDVSLSPGLTP